MEGSCDHGNETSGSMKWREILESLIDFWPLKKDFVPWKYLVHNQISWKYILKYFYLTLQHRICTDTAHLLECPCTWAVYLLTSDIITQKHYYYRLGLQVYLWSHVICCLMDHTYHSPGGSLPASYRGSHWISWDICGWRRKFLSENFGFLLPVACTIGLYEATVPRDLFPLLLKIVPHETDYSNFQAWDLEKLILLRLQ
jgi:hypothetical protein